MYTTLKVSSDLNRAIMLRSFNDRSTKRSTSPTVRLQRKQAVFGTKSYNDALQRAFNKAKEQVFFNPDMTNFVTLTYAKADNTVEEVLHDIKMLVKREQRERARNPDGESGVKTAKYIFIMEYQKRGSIHVHMIANNFFTLQVNANGYRELAYWRKGFSSVLTIKDFDNNFKPYLYLFKYMKKSQRIGKSFVHTSRNLNNYTETHDTTINLDHWRTLNMERTETTVGTTKFVFYKNYLKFDDTINLQTNEELQQWHEQVKLHSMRELEKLVKNHSQHYA